MIRVSVCATPSFECLFVYENLPVQTKIINGRSRMKFYLKHRWGGGKASVGFDLDLIRTLVSMATVSSHRNTVGKGHHLILECF